MTLLVEPITNWWCPECKHTDQTRQAGPHTRMHVCPRLHGLTTPMVRAGTRARITAREREDYVNGELVQVDDRGRPVMSIVTERPDGSNDTRVLAPAARVTVEARERWSRTPVQERLRMMRRWLLRRSLR
jgi:hypothetical protein